jgi:predicted  nucleic acid-binding Zn-ribbon protein
MPTKFDYIIGQIKNLETSHAGELRYSASLENEIERLQEKIKSLEKELAAIRKRV